MKLIKMKREGRKKLKANNYLAKKLITLRTLLRERDTQISTLKEEIELLKRSQRQFMKEFIELNEGLKKVSTNGVSREGSKLKGKGMKKKNEKIKEK